MSGRSRWLAGALVALVAVAALAWTVRDVDGLRYRFVADPRVPGTADVPEQAGWFSRDPDGLYHTRRVARALDEGLAVAGRDPRLAFPDGAPIPWPPYYDQFCALALAPFAPAELPARRIWLEHAVATLPALFAVATALLAACAAWSLARDRRAPAATAAALVAGITLALCRSSINYSVVGAGDHHAWVSLLHGLLLVVATAALGPRALQSRARSLGLGVAAGALGGLLLGSWVAALLYVLGLQVVLGWMLRRRAREDQPGLAVFGLAFHVTALLVLLPAVLASPWRVEHPWIVVDLSWFHLAELALGAAVFVPPAIAGRGRLASGTRAARRYPWGVAAVLAAGALALQFTGAGPAAGIAEGFAWVSRVNAFMGTVQESAPLLGPRSGGVDQLFLALGYGVVLLPIAWALLAREAVLRRRDAWLPWVVVTPLLLAQALTQRRFGEALALPMAVVLGYGAARLFPSTATDGERRARFGLLPLAAALAAVVLQWPSLNMSLVALRGDERWEVGGPADTILGNRMLYEWIRGHTPPGEDYAVLAHWDRGHAIEWVADRPSVATNFGSYVGEDGYRDPSRFFLEQDPLRARALLERRRVRYVIVPASLPMNVASMIRATDPDLLHRYLRAGSDGGSETTPAWLATMGARLLAHGYQVVPPEVPAEARSNPLGFLRLVYVSPWVDPGFPRPGTATPQPSGFVWEHVPGAMVAATGEPGEVLRVEFRISYARAGYSVNWGAAERCDDRGVARLWIPYATDAPNGDGTVQDARWTLGERGGALVIPEVSVEGGRPIVLQ